MSKVAIFLRVPSTDALKQLHGVVKAALANFTLIGDVDNADIEIVFTESGVADVKTPAADMIRLYTGTEKVSSPWYFRTTPKSTEAVAKINAVIRASEARRQLVSAAVKIRQEKRRLGQYGAFDSNGRNLRESYGLVPVRDLSVMLSGFDIAASHPELSEYLGVPVTGSGDPIPYLIVSSGDYEGSYVKQISLHDYKSSREKLDSKQHVHIYTDLEQVKLDMKLMASVIRLGCDMLSIRACEVPMTSVRETVRSALAQQISAQ